MSASLVGSEMCIRDRGEAYAVAYRTATRASAHPRSCPSLRKALYERPPVSYTHLTLPTICSV
eukprot:14590634-Alexandrium_andersonii.AAC.1